MKYVLLIYSNPESRGVWAGLSEAERGAGLSAYTGLTGDLDASGELLAAAALAPPSRGRRVTVQGGRPVTTDGPYAEAKEYLAGVFLLECESLERATAHAGRIPEAAHGLVEVRPVLDGGAAADLAAAADARPRADAAGPGRPA
jgi:hypothetical protein